MASLIRFFGMLDGRLVAVVVVAEWSVWLVGELVLVDCLIKLGRSGGGCFFERFLVVFCCRLVGLVLVDLWIGQLF